MNRRDLLKGLAALSVASIAAAPADDGPAYRRRAVGAWTYLEARQSDGSWRVVLSWTLSPVYHHPARHHADPLPGPVIIDTPGHVKGQPAVPTPLAVEPAPGLPYYRPR